MGMGGASRNKTGAAGEANLRKGAGRDHCR